MVECDKGDTLLVLADDFFVEPLKGFSGGRVIGEVVHLKEVVKRFNDDDTDVTVIGENFVEFLEMIIGRGRLEDNNRVVLCHAAIGEIFSGVFSRFFTLPVGNFGFHGIASKKLFSLGDGDSELTSDGTFAGVRRTAQQTNALTVGAE